MSKEIKVQKNKSAQKFFTWLSAIVLVFLCLLGYFLGGMFNSLTDSLIMGGVILGAIVLCLLVYMLIRLCSNSHFIFNDKGLYEYKRNELIKEIRWEQIENLKHGIFWFTSDIPIPLGVSYLSFMFTNTDGESRFFNTPLSKRDAERIEETLGVELRRPQPLPVQRLLLRHRNRPLLPQNPLL